MTDRFGDWCCETLFTPPEQRAGMGEPVKIRKLDIDSSLIKMFFFSGKTSYFSFRPTERVLLLVLCLELRQQEAGQHLLARVLVVVRLEVEHRLGLVLRQPEGLQVEVRHREGEVGQPVAAHVEHVQLGARADLVGQVEQLVLAQGEHAQVDEVADGGRELLEAVAVHVEVGQPGQVAQAGGQLADVVLGQDQLLQTDTSEENE